MGGGTPSPAARENENGERIPRRLRRNEDGRWNPVPSGEGKQGRGFVSPGEENNRDKTSPFRQRFAACMATGIGEAPL